MDTYEIYNIIPKFGAMELVHSTILRRPCWILRLEIGRRCWLLVDVGDEKLVPHRIALSIVTSVQGMPGDSEIWIKTECTFYCLRKISDHRKQHYPE